MIHIHLICLGKLKEKYWQAAETEYLKRLSPYFNIQIHELKEESFGEKDSVEMIKEKEADKIERELEKIKSNYIIILDSAGSDFSSEKFAQTFNNLTVEQFNHISFVIGGPLGLNKKILQKANLKLSLSKMTFTHQMARVILWEQIYRAAMINNGRKYHY
ncbi:MAG: Ribosomal RNA large subunit methyltransferase H [Candidatus Magasanikbacteria bacterium GW2011_GWC2_34_16]|uniref:Ribosomal RNA large subunit methyltransferase H n=2 Tax=Candidatus Magasanikiibacteriota TaxID=1752731 RepID=A0A0G0HC56_9BACT|nr:MAG: Ribosomal RNA large subunit methyltransferase H [Candidatus Magasanikbacteria bacterium GW2011_GWC2_34_16]KKQ39752.1 MAG: Ribosomal RNA large subunit methyltransferase H [Candidatus Magasanikbacteria bacterium GW2011_GWA2_37_8]